MKFRIEPRWLVALLVLVLLLPGCKKFKAKSDNSDQQSGSNNHISNVQNQGGGGAVENVRAAALRPGVENDLKQLATYYTMYTLTNNRPPASLMDLPDVKRDLPKLYKEITDGVIIVLWNADPARAPAGSSNTVFAYVAKPSPQGRIAAFLDGHVLNMSEADFAKTAKAGM